MIQKYFNRKKHFILFGVLFLFFISKAQASVLSMPIQVTLSTLGLLCTISGCTPSNTELTDQLSADKFQQTSIQREVARKSSEMLAGNGTKPNNSIALDFNRLRNNHIDPYPTLRNHQMYKGIDENKRVIISENGRTLTVNIPSGSYGSDGGMAVKLDMPLGEKAYIGFFVNIQGVENLAKMGKLGGFCIGVPGSSNNCATGLKKADGTNGTSSRFTWRKPNKESSSIFPGGYFYLLNKWLSGSNKNEKPYTYAPAPYTKAQTQIDAYGLQISNVSKPFFDFQTEEWNYLEMYLELNDPGQANGKVRMNLDGKVIADLVGLVFRNNKEELILGPALDFFSGGGKDYPTSGEAQIRIKDLKVEPYTRSIFR